MQYPSLREQTIGKATAKFSDAVIVKGPAFADDAMNVPLLVDARALSAVGGGVVRIKVSVDRNPVRQVLDFEPLRALPMLAFRIRMEQASPVRAFVQTKDGQWHVGSTWVQAAGEKALFSSPGSEWPLDHFWVDGSKISVFLLSWASAFIPPITKTLPSKAPAARARRWNG